MALLGLLGCYKQYWFQIVAYSGFLLRLLILSDKKIYNIVLLFFLTILLLIQNKEKHIGCFFYQRLSDMLFAFVCNHTHILCMHMVFLHSVYLIWLFIILRSELCASGLRFSTCLLSGNVPKSCL